MHICANASHLVYSQCCLINWGNDILHMTSVHLKSILVTFQYEQCTLLYSAHPNTLLNAYIGWKTLWCKKEDATIPCASSNIFSFLKSSNKIVFRNPIQSLKSSKIRSFNKINRNRIISRFTRREMLVVLFHISISICVLCMCQLYDQIPQLSKIKKKK